MEGNRKRDGRLKRTSENRGKSQYCHSSYMDMLDRGYLSLEEIFEVFFPGMEMCFMGLRILPHASFTALILSPIESKVLGHRNSIHFLIHTN